MSVKTMSQMGLEMILEFDKIIGDFWLSVIDEYDQLPDDRKTFLRNVYQTSREEIRGFLDRIRAATPPSSPAPPERSPSVARASPRARDARGRFAKRSKSRRVKTIKLR